MSESVGTKRLARVVAPVVTAICFGYLFAGARPLGAEPESEPAGLTREEQERFLRIAEILGMQEVGIGTTGSKRATLSDGRLTHDAHIQTVDVFMQKFVAGPRSELNFRDFWGFNVAAYRLARLLDLDVVPVSVEREVEGQPASVTWWVDRVTMSMGEYREGDHKAPNLTWFDDQRRRIWAFQQLILNRDPNLGNDVIDEDWKIWALDFTRAFRPWGKLDDVKILTRVPRTFYDSLRNLDLAAVERELEPYLKKSEMKGLLARHKKLLEHYEAKIKKHGEAVVLIDLEARRPEPEFREFR